MITVCVIVIAIACGGWLLRISGNIVIPILLGALVAFLLETLSRAASRIPYIGARTPKLLRLALSFLLTFVLLLSAIVLVARNLEQVVRVAPGYADVLTSLANATALRFGYDVNVTWHLLQETLDQNFDIQSLVRYGVGTVSNSIAYVFLVFIYAIFFLVELNVFDRKIGLIFRTPETETHARELMDMVLEKVGDYVALKTLINILLGFVCWAVLRYYGIDLAVFWAILTGVFNYIPYVGSLIAVLLPVFVSVGQYESLQTTVSLAMWLILVQNFVGYYLEPRLLGKQLNLSPLIIITSLAAWGALWGIAGAILSVPLTATIMIVFAAYPTTRPMAILLSQDGSIAERPDSPKDVAESTPAE